RVDSGEGGPPRARSRRAELGFGVAHDRGGARTVSDVERFAEDFPRLGAAIAPPQHGAEVSECARSFELCLAACEVVDSLAKQRLSTVAAGYESGAALCDAQRTRGAERFG